MACNCPLPSALTAITATTCPEDLGQIQRLFFVRKGYLIWDTVTPANNVPATIVGDLITEVAGWTTLLAAVDNTKVIKTPLIGGDPVINAGDINQTGGNDNSTLNGEVYFNSLNPSTFTARFDQLTAAQTAQFKNLACESLEVYFINQDGDIIARRDGDNVTGFPVKGATVLQSRSVQGFGTRNSNNIQFQLDADWDEYFEKFTPTDFNALTF